MDNDERISRACSGDVEAFNELVLEYQDQVFNHAYRILGDFNDAEDATQETFIRAYGKRSQFHGGSYRAWLYRIATNLCYDQIRTWTRRPTQPLEPINEFGEEFDSPYWMQDPRPLPEEEAETAEFHASLQRALNTLPVHYRTAVSLIDIQEMPHQEAAEIMGVPVGTVKSRVARGRGMLRDLLRAQPAGTMHLLPQMGQPG